uniref:Uncharacterized protein n=1 Tax=Canis lupus familiaris TaxID=9615 RepID=A0A8C0Z123_CANLF
MHFHNIYLLQQSIISEKYQVFIKLLGMADSQNMLVTLHSSMLLLLTFLLCFQTLAKVGLSIPTRVIPICTVL